MKHAHPIQSISYLKAHASDLVAQVRETGQSVYITQNGSAAAVLQDPETYEQTRKALALLKLFAQGEEEIRKGRGIPQDEVFASIRTKLARRHALT